MAGLKVTVYSVSESSSRVSASTPIFAVHSLSIYSGVVNSNLCTGLRIGGTPCGLRLNAKYRIALIIYVVRVN